MHLRLRFPIARQLVLVLVLAPAVAAQQPIEKPTVEEKSKSSSGATKAPGGRLSFARTNRSQRRFSPLPPPPSSLSPAARRTLSVQPAGFSPQTSRSMRSILVANDNPSVSSADFADIALPTAEKTNTEARTQTQIQELPPPARDGRRPLIAPGSRKSEQANASSTIDPLGALPPELVAPPAKGEIRAKDVDESGNRTGNVPETSSETAKHQEAFKYDDNVFFGAPYGASAERPHYDGIGREVPFDSSAFLPQPVITNPLDPFAEGAIYRNKRPVPVQRPWVELWRPLYTGGLYPPAKTWFGEYNLVMPHFMVYGDFRTAVGINRNVNGNSDVWASRLNLDMDLEITATERIHAFMGPLDRNGDFTRLDFTDGIDFVNRMDMRLDTLFFEGDVGSILGGFQGHDSRFDLPIAFGFMPLFYQNGVWAADNVIGAAAAIPARHSRLLDWSNYDATVFWASDQVNTDAFAGDNNAAELFGTAWFIEAYDGYLEVNYAFVHDDVGGNRSYHNFAVAFTKRYFYRVSNAVRFITNFGQSLPSEQRTADGHLLLIENSLISKSPNTVVPYLNFFYGQGRTQGLARAVGGVLNNTGINFETDGLTGFPTLDPTGVNTVGAAAGINLLGSQFDHQLVLEFAALSANGSSRFRNAAGDQYAVGVRYQKPLNNFLIFRTDHMGGFLRNSRDIFGSRMELRWKF